MYGTVARLRIRPGAEEDLARYADEVTSADTPPGMVAECLYRTDADPREFILAVAFASKEAYWANAGSPEQHARYERLRQLLDAEPEWADGEIVHTYPAADS
jgi:heme-degrading monooxygenase HmoA